jgi:outer membrane protein TolC
MSRLARLCLLLLFPLAVRAGEKNIARPTELRLTLESAIQAALAKNFSIQVQRFEPKIAKEIVTRELGQFDPVFELTAERGEDTSTDVFSNSIHLATRSVNRTDRFSAGLRGATALGLTYDLGIGSRNVLGTFNRFFDDYQSKASIALRQPLLRDFGPAANLAQVRIARNNQLVSEWSLRKRIIDIITETNFVYNELHFAHENMRVAIRSRELARQLLKDNQARVEIGVKSPLDVTEARAQVAAREEGVILAQRAVLDNENLLKRLVTSDLESLLAVRVVIAPPPSPGFTADVPGGIREALDLRPDYRQAVLEIERRNITLAFARNQSLIRFDLVGSLALLGFDNDLGGSFERVPRRDQTAWTVGAIVSIPIPNREGRGAKNAALLEAAKSLVALQELEQQIVVDVDNSSGQITTSHERIASTSEASRLAKESLDAGEERLRAGTGTTFEVLELQKKLTEAEAAELRARSDYNKAISEYQRQTGTSLRVNNVVFN